MGSSLLNKVVVITGASSGIGLSTARRFASEGATLVLGARRDGALEAAAALCERDGGRALTLPVDVSDEDQVRALCDKALAELGRIDIWVNNAGVMMFSRFEDAPPEAFRRLFDVNFFGCVHGARAALPLFREQRHGVLINVSSVYGRIGAPYLSAYVASKFAILGLTESLRQEVLDEPRIHVCALLPASIDTPTFQHAANFTGIAVKPISPIYGPDKVARAIVRMSRWPKRERVVGSFGRAAISLRTMSPSLTERVTAETVLRGHFQDKPSLPSNGSLMKPMPDWTQETGGWRLGRRRGSLVVPVALGLAALGGIWLYRRRS